MLPVDSEPFPGLPHFGRNPGIMYHVPCDWAVVIYCINLPISISLAYSPRHLTRPLSTTTSSSSSSFFFLCPPDSIWAHTTLRRARNTANQNLTTLPRISPQVILPRKTTEQQQHDREIRKLRVTKGSRSPSFTLRAATIYSYPLHPQSQRRRGSDQVRPAH